MSAVALQYSASLQVKGKDGGVGTATKVTVTVAP
jgi:hypothetical protein